MGSEFKFLRWPFAMIIIALVTFFITKDVSGNIALATLAVAFASIIIAALAATTVSIDAPATSAAFISALAAATAASAALVVVLAVLVSPLTAIFIALIAAIFASIVALDALEYAKKNDLNEKYALFAAVAETLVIFSVMLWHIIAHQEQVMVVTLRLFIDVFM